MKTIRMIFYEVCTIIDLMGEVMYIQADWSGACDDVDQFSIPENCQFLDYTGVPLALQAGIQLQDAVNLCYIPDGRWYLYIF